MNQPPLDPPILDMDDPHELDDCDMFFLECQREDLGVDILRGIALGEGWDTLADMQLRYMRICVEIDRRNEAVPEARDDLDMDDGAYNERRGK